MKNLITALTFLLAPTFVLAGERVSGENSYARKEQNWQLNNSVYWQQTNVGTFTVTEGPLDPGFVDCLGAGFGRAEGVRGEGICIFENAEGSFTWTWQAIPGALNQWQVAAATGKYKGMTGSGTAKSRIQSEFTAMQHRVTTWEGEIELPN